MLEIPSRLKTLALLGGAACTMGGGLVLWKDALEGEKYEIGKGGGARETKSGAENKVFIVTGANSGIGKEITHQLARERGKVFMACRDLAKCEEVRREIVLDTRNKYVYCRKCDLGSFNSIRDFVNQFNKQETECHVLINNAGVMNCRKMLTKDGFESQLGINHLGPYLLSQLLRPSLGRSGEGRIVYLTNLDYRKGTIDFSDLNSDKCYDPSTAFYQSQLANILTIQSLSQECADDKITVNAAYPGVCRTNIKRHMGVDKSISGNFLANPILWFFERRPTAGAQTPLYLSLDPALVGVTATLWSNMEELPVLESATDQVLVKKMSVVSKYWTGLMDKPSTSLQI